MCCNTGTHQIWCQHYTPRNASEKATRLLMVLTTPPEQRDPMTAEISRRIIAHIIQAVKEDT
jgi:hypothetical protein